MSQDSKPAAENVVQNRSKYLDENGKFAKGNPGGGRPRKKPITIAAEQLLGHKIPRNHALARSVPELAGKTWAEAIVYGQTLEAIKGHTDAASFVADHGEGKVSQPVEMAVTAGAMFQEAAETLAASKGRR